MKTKLWLLLAGAIFVLAPRQVEASGACTAARFHDWNDMGCNQNAASAGTPPKGGCPPCNGMPRWWVSEPYINLCMADTPLSYAMSSGQEMAFKFYYRQRTKLPDADEVTALPTASPYDIYPTAVNCGTNASWGNNWNLSITIWDPTWESSWVSGVGNTIHPAYAPYTRGYQVFVWRPEGGINYFNVATGQQNIYDPKSLMRLTSVTSGQNYPIVETATGTYPGYTINNAPTPDANGIYWGNSGVGLTLVYPDGSQDVFGLTPFFIKDYTMPNTFSTAGTSESRLLLTQRIDPQGRVTQLGYDYVTNTSPYGVYYFRLHYVVDPDGRTNTFNYSSGLQISEIDDPYGRKAKLAYGTLYGSKTAPTNIVDAAGLTNSFSYQGQQTNGWITSLTTPYGQTRFNYYSVADSSVTDGYQQRAIYVSEPTGAQQLYLYQHQNPGFVSANETSPTVPGQTFDDGSTGGTSGHGAMTYRNTFHWGRRQFEALSGNYYFNEGMSESLSYQFSNPSFSQSEFASALSALGTSDYNKAEEKHWLMSSADDVSITEGLSSERDPSPDPAGSIPGLRTWYNYPGKPSPELMGSSQQPTCVARILPDDNSQYTTYNYYATTGIPGFPAGAGFVSDNEASYSKLDGTIGVLTNWFHYAANSVDLASVSNSAGQYVNYGFNGSHQITAATNALNQVTTLGWDVGNTWNLTSVQLPAGKSISLSYNSPASPPTATSSMLQQISISPEGRSFTVNSYSAGLPASVTDDRGLTVANTWDGLNRLTGTVFPDSTTISNVYYRLDLVGTKDRLGNWTRYAFDGLQHLVSVTNANNAVTTYSYCGCGLLESIVDALTNLTSFNYDNQGNLTNIVYPDYSSETWQFDLAGRMTNAFDGAGRFVQIGYNNQGLPTSVATANGTLRQTIYDSLNRPISITDANGVTITNQFDALNELLKRTWPDAISEGYGYSAAGLVAYTNRDQKVTRYGLDAAGRLTSVTNANTEVTQFGYDSLNNVTSLIDGLLHQTTWQYNEYGWLTNKTDGLTRNVERFAFNANGWITNRWTPEKGNTGYTYDNVGNLKSIVYPQQTITYAYDVLNRLTNMVDGVGTTAFGYTPAGRLQSENGPWANDTLTYTYVQGLRTALSLSQTTSNWSQTYGFDSGWRMTNTVSPAGAFAYSYNFQPASSLVTGIQLPNGANIVNSYDSLARLTGTALNNHWGHTLDGYTYTPDALGLRTNIVRNLGLTSSTVTAGFDNSGQLNSWTATDAGGTPRLNEQLGFGFDASDNLHSRTNGSLIQSFTMDGANELTNVSRAGTFTMSGATPAPATSVTVNGQAAQTYGDFTFAATNLTLANGNNTFTNIAQNIYGVAVTNVFTVNLPSSVIPLYDSNGNLTNDGAKTLAYDAENQLTNVFVASQWRSDFIYDGLNRRRIEKDYSWSGFAWVKTNETRFIYDGYLLVQERDTNNNVLVTYTRGLDLSSSINGAGGIGGLLARTDGNGSTFYHADGIGNITALMDGSQNIVARYLYNPFGKLTGQWGTMANANLMRFSSMPVHRLSGFPHYPFRDLDTDFPQWLTPDPIQEYGGINLRRFVNNNPLFYIDPYGLYTWSEWGQIVGAGTGGWSDAADSIGQTVGGSLNTAYDAGTGNWNQLNSDLNYIANQQDLSQNSYDALAGLDPTGLLKTDPCDKNAEAGMWLGMAAGMLDGGGEASAARKLAQKLEGKSAQEIDQIMKELGWEASETRKPGVRYADPNRPGDQVRVMPGKSTDPNPIKQNPYVRVSVSGQTVGPMPIK